MQNAEPGWMAGEIRGHTGWFPESYVEPVDTGTVALDNEHTFIQQDSVEKRTLESVKFLFTLIFAKYHRSIFPCVSFTNIRIFYFNYREIAEVPENVSDAGSLGGEAPIVEAIIPTLGLGTSCHVEATTLFPYRPTMEQHLSFEKGETIYVSEQQVIKYI